MAEALVPIESANESEWKLIGELVEIITYPIDTGFGFTTPRAQVTKYGMNSENYAVMTFLPIRVYRFTMNDRTLIPVKGNNAALFHSQVAEIRHTTIINELDMAQRVHRPHTINYLGHPTDVYKIDTTATQHHIKMSKDITKDLPCDFSYLPQAERCENFNEFVQQPNEPNEINNGYLANYSPFMLINKKSLESLRVETGKRGISRSDFRPNFVIDTATPYCEERISHLKIGSKVEFQNIIPCTHTFTKINENGEEKKDELFEILQRKHSVNFKYPRETASSWLPAFGINMQAKEVGEIAIGDQVYAKFNKKLG